MMKSSAYFMGIFFLVNIFLHTACLGENEPQEEDAIAYQAAYNLVLDEKWGVALQEFDRMLKQYPRSAWVDDARFWQCYSREKIKESPEKVFDCYYDFIDKYPSSKWVDQANANLIRIGHQLVKSGKKEYEAIIESIKESENEEIALAALYALQDIGDERALKAITDLYDRNDNPNIRGNLGCII